MEMGFVKDTGGGGGKKRAAPRQEKGTNKEPKRAKDARGAGVGMSFDGKTSATGEHSTLAAVWVHRRGGCEEAPSYEMAVDCRWRIIGWRRIRH